jgi:extracellular factor (EF) 3-hydroxypalmitic acid methyl ester biosynthesis protein
VLPLNLIEPVVTFRNSQGTAVRGTLTSLQRRALVLEIYNPYSIVQVSEVLSELTLRAGQKAVYQGRAVVTSLLNTGLMAVVSVTLIDEWSDLDSASDVVSMVGEEARRFVDEWQDRFRVQRPYQVAVSEMRAFLSDTARWLDQADLSRALPRDSEGRLRTDVFGEVAKPIAGRVAEFVARLEEQARLVPDEDAVVHRAFAQAALHPLLLRAPFAYRAFVKPLGYAGDHEMVNQILGDPRQGPSTYFQVINSMYMQTAVARAHRNRVELLVDRLRAAAQRAAEASRPLRVLKIGCGPAAELQRLLLPRPLPAAMEITLIDFNEEALAFVGAWLRAQVLPGTDVKVRLVRESVHDLLRRRADSAPRTSDFDLIYCAGLFDYLSDKICARLIRQFLRQIAGHGTVLVTNVHPSNPQRYVMEHVLEWHLVYRDETALRQLFPLTEVAVTTYTDATGVNAFAEAKLIEVSRPTSGQYG